MSGDWQAAEHNVLQCWYENSHSAEWNENKRKSFFLFLWLTFVLCGWWFYMVIWMPGKQLPMSRTLISVSNYIPQHLSHSIAFNNSDLWKRKVSLDISHHVPLFLHQQGVDNLKGTVVLDFNKDWATESAKLFPWQGCQMTELFYLPLLQTNRTQKNNNQHTIQGYTSLWCCVPSHRLRGGKELLMHLIKEPFESSRAYRHAFLLENAYRAGSALVEHIRVYQETCCLHCQRTARG